MQMFYMMHHQQDFNLVHLIESIYLKINIILINLFSFFIFRIGVKKDLAERIPLKSLLDESKAVIVSSTSWGNDEDVIFKKLIFFSILFNLFV